MRIKTRERIIRIVTSSLLSSNLTSGEIEEIAEALIAQDDFVPELGKVLKQLTTAMGKGSTHKEPSTNTYSSDLHKTIINQAVAIIKKKRIPKDLINSKLSSTFPDLSHLYEGEKDKLSVRELLSEVLSAKGTSDFNEFMTSIAPNTVNDEYLKGILDR